MRLIVAAAFLLLGATAAHAEDSAPAGEASSIVPSVTDYAPTQPAVELAPVQLEERALADHPEALAQDMPQRGSFWWVVGAIVVAGVILAVVL